MSTPNTSYKFWDIYILLRTNVYTLIHE
jgi:hypothetical protein